MAAFPPYVTLGGKTWHYGFRTICGLILLFLILPILVVIPLSFNSEPYFTYPIPSFSLRWYQEFIEKEIWILAIQNSVIVGFFATILATTLGTVAALGLSRASLPYKSTIMGVLISPMIVPLVISAVGMKFFYAEPLTYLGLGFIDTALSSWGLIEDKLRLTNNLAGLVVAHTALGTPFVVITVTATLVGFDRSLIRAASNLGANPRTVFFKITMPLVLPGMISGGLFAFITSFDEVVVVLFLAGRDEYTIPRQMFSGIREQISPTILAVATILVIISIMLLATLEMLRRRNERMRGIRTT